MFEFDDVPMPVRHNGPLGGQLMALLGAMPLHKSKFLPGEKATVITGYFRKHRPKRFMVRTVEEIDPNGDPNTPVRGSRVWRLE